MAVASPCLSFPSHLPAVSSLASAAAPRAGDHHGQAGQFGTTKAILHRPRTRTLAFPSRENVGLSRGRISTARCAVTEKVADGYAADLLIPHYLFALRAAALDHIAFDSIGGLGQAFKTSLTATAIYPVDRNTPCAMRRESTPYVEYRCQFSLTYSAMPRAGLYNG